MAKARALYGDAQIQPSDVRVESVLTASKVSHTFNLNGNGSTKRPLEQYISNNDLFIMYALKVGVQKVSTLPTLAAISGGNYPVYTYPDKYVFDDAGTVNNVSEANALEAVFNGSMGMKANTYELINQVKLNRFRNVPETQASLTTQAETHIENFVIFEQPAILSGRDTNLLDFIAAQGADTALIGGKADTENVLVFQALGLTVRDGALAATFVELEGMTYEQRLKKLTIDGRLLK